MKSIRSSHLLAIILTLGILFAIPAQGFAKWWDKLGKPTYGGSITLVADFHIQNFDVHKFDSGEWQLWHDSMVEPDWTVDRKIWSFSGMFNPDQYWTGTLANSWELTDPATMTVRLRKNVIWQNKPPMNGRKFVASDIVHHYNRMMGWGGGYTEPNPMFAGMLANWKSVTAPDDYTVVFEFKTPCGGTAFQSIADMACFNLIEAPESVKEQGGRLTDWKKAVGTGPWMLTNFVANSSLTFGKNPDYWLNDPRYPKNKVPYLDEVRLVVIKDRATQLAALRTGKIDLITGVSWQQAKSLGKTNPDLKMLKMPGGMGGSMSVNTSYGVGFRMDKAPFTDIRVRKALQMAIDREAMAKGYYGGTASGIPCGILTQEYKGYAFEYKDWPKELKDEYKYNPAKAKKLLAEAGYPKGFKTNLVASNSEDLQLMQVFKQYFMDIGVDMEIKSMDHAAKANLTESGKHDQMATGGGGFTWPPPRVIEEYYSKGRGNNIHQANDPDYDALCNKYWSAANPAQAAKAMMEADKYIIEHHWFVGGPETFSYNVFQPYLKGYSGEALLWGQKYYYSRFWIDQKLKKSMGR